MGGVLSDAAAAEVGRHFHDDLCRQLLCLVTSLSTLDSEAPVPEQVRCGLTALYEEQAEFACWARQLTESCCIDIISHPQRLAEMLVRSPSWLDLAGAETALPRQLFSVAAMALRLRALEHNIAAEVDQRKTDAVYQLAYGLSHELNNPLSIIASRAGTLALSEPRSDRREVLELLVDTAMRGGEMLGDLMLVARPPELTRRMSDAAELSHTLVAKARDWGRIQGVELVAEISCRQPVSVDAAALHEALWCLIRNAIEAMPDGGCLQIRVFDTPEHVVWKLVDAGAGLSSAAQGHLFDPFYSGREAGRGLGLGLTKAKRLVELHDGRLAVYNLPTGGCAAEVFIPSVRFPPNDRRSLS